MFRNIHMPQEFAWRGAVFLNLEIESWFPKGSEELYFGAPVHHNLKPCILS
jgi:hypothetical protein